MTVFTSPRVVIVPRPSFLGGGISHAECWSSTASGDGLHHTSFATAAEARAWFAKHNVPNPATQTRTW